MTRYDSDPLRFEKPLERIKRLRADAPLDVVHELDEPLREWRRHANLTREGHDDAKLRIDLRRTLADRQVAPDPAVRFRRTPVVRDERIQRPLGRTLRRVTLVGQWIEAVERLRCHPSRAGDGVDLSSEANVQIAMP